MSAISPNDKGTEWVLNCFILCYSLTEESHLVGLLEEWQQFLNSNAYVENLEVTICENGKKKPADFVFSLDRE